MSNCGGKAESLLTLKYAGFPVPNFMIVKEDDINEEILRDFEYMEFDKVAVRSSSTIEDGKDFSCAGMHDSFLNVNKEELLEKISLVRSSLSSSRASNYKKENNIKDSKMAVIVQSMVKAEKAGVAFSVHPVTEDSDVILIEAVEGLADDYVSGKVTPSSYEIHKSNSVIDKYVLGLLTPYEVGELSKIIIDIENHYQYPVDVEWCFANNKFWIVQCRPITTLK